MRLNQLLDCLETLNPSYVLPELPKMPVVPSFLGAQAGQSLNHLTVCAKEFFDFNAFDKIKMGKALKAIGTPISENENFVNTRAGWLNANPAVVFATQVQNHESDCIFIICFAKEGLINQKTALKGINRLEAAMKKQGLDFQSTTIVPLTRLPRAGMEK